MFEYLADTSVAPMNCDFVQTDDPYCSSVDVSIAEQTRCEITANFYDVPVEKIEEIRDR